MLFHGALRVERNNLFPKQLYIYMGVGKLIITREWECCTVRRAVCFCLQPIAKCRPMQD